LGWPGHRSDCTKFAVVTDSADCPNHDGCYRPEDAELEALYQEFQRTCGTHEALMAS
jgi:hypothetical protein